MFMPGKRSDQDGIWFGLKFAAFFSEQISLNKAHDRKFPNQVEAKWNELGAEEIVLDRPTIPRKPEKPALMSSPESA